MQHRAPDTGHADSPLFEHERERCSDQQRLRPRVGAVVDARGIAARCEQHGHEERGCSSEPDRDAEQRATRASRESQQEK
jgi:hypothetical protein